MLTSIYSDIVSENSLIEGETKSEAVIKVHPPAISTSIKVSSDSDEIDVMKKMKELQGRVSSLESMNETLTIQLHESETLRKTVKERDERLVTGEVHADHHRREVDARDREIMHLRNALEREREALRKVTAMESTREEVVSMVEYTKVMYSIMGRY
jgi:predicted RNase H-like nuclease (RuvC/YqgF family)